MQNLGINISAQTVVLEARISNVYWHVFGHTQRTANREELDQIPAKWVVPVL